MEKEKSDPVLTIEISPEDHTPKLLPDTEINPFITEEERVAILAGKIQDPEWD
jgi:hypothetical protein